MPMSRYEESVKLSAPSNEAKLLAALNKFVELSQWN